MENEMKRASSPAVADPASPASRLIDLKLTDVTGGRRVEITGVHAETPVARVLEAAAQELGIPENQPVSLRRDDTSLIPVNARIGEAVSPDQHEELTVVPNAHLGQAA